MASHSWGSASCPDRWDSGCPAPWPCSPPAEVSWGELAMTSRSLSPALQQQVSRCKRQRRGHGHRLSRGRLEELCRPLKEETLPAAQGEMSP